MIEFIFSISTGRAGSLYLSELLGTIHDCVSYHEPEPQMNGDFMRALLKKRSLKGNLAEEMRRKYLTIVGAKGSKSYYAETSHIFIKGFGWHITNYIPPEKIGVVILERDKDQIVDSLHRINCLPTNELGHKWICTPKNCKPLVQFPEPFARLKCTGFAAAKRFGLLSSRIERFEREMLGWYVDEVTELTKKFQRKFPDIRTFRTSAERLNQQSEIYRLADAFALNRPDPSRLEPLLGKRLNRKE